ncbi:restriction endonuclease subunit S [Vibrio crassostreae]|uniref:restriction endonuclease subunit S n=1 Tax=Vibrio crassostreae TaxID=246167 RepID=UPI001B30D6EA|nr:restriction endonuclease subunit S [Vibrio crassostreae]
MSISVQKLGELVTIKGGGTPSKKIDEYWNGDIPWASVKDLKTRVLSKAEDYITTQGAENSATNIIPKGTIIVPTRMALGKVAIAGVDLAINQDLKALFIKDENVLDKQYLARFLESKAKYIEGEGKGATVKGITLDFLKSIEIPLPPLAEQKRIAAILDKADTIRQKRKQAIDLADEFLRSVFLDMFGDPVSNPKGWEVFELKDSIVHANNGLSRRRKTEENIGQIVLRLQDVHYDGIRFTKELNRIELEENEKAKFELAKGDLLFIRVNGNPEYVGRSAVFRGFEEPIFHNDHLIRLKFNNFYNSKFLSYTFNLSGGKKIIAANTKTSAGQHTISQSGIESLRFYQPPKGLQDKFVEILDSVINELEQQYKSVEELDQLFNSLSQKAFSGEL